MLLILEQVLNGLQYGVTLFLLAAGLTLIFGIMGVINLAHGSLYMIGAFAGVYVGSLTGSYVMGMAGAIAAGAAAGLAMEALVVRRLYARDHLDQVLATFAVILIANQAIVLLFGRQPLYAPIPAALAQPVTLGTGFQYPAYRLFVIAAGLGVAGLLYLLINHTRIGMLVRAGSSNREMVRALGVNIRWLYTSVFVLGALLASFAGFVAGPIYSVEAGMGERIILATFVVVVVGGLGSIKGAFVAALVLGMIDTLMRGVLPEIMRLLLEPSQADALSAGLASMGIYLVMALFLLVRPRGLFAPGS